jgi:hypothetical protein
MTALEAIVGRQIIRFKTRGIAGRALSFGSKQKLKIGAEGAKSIDFNGAKPIGGFI